MSSPYELLTGLALLREKKRLADNSSDKSLESWSALVVRLGHEICVLRQDEVDEIIAQDKLNKVNGVAPWVVGLGYFRGQLLNILDGQHLFACGDETRNDAAARIMVVGGEEEWFGFRVNELLGIRHVWSDSTDSLAATENSGKPWSGYVGQWIKIEKKMVPVLEIKRLVLELERAGEFDSVQMST